MKKRIFEFILILLLGLIPLLWFKPGYLIGGVDFDLPPYPIDKFFLRKFTWSTIYLGGVDRSMDIPGGLCFIGTQALLKSIGLNLPAVQRITFVFWFMLSGVAMYFFISQLIKGRDFKSTIIRSIAVFFYMINFYQLHIWMIARIGELSGSILIPVTLGLLIKKMREGISYGKVLFWGSIFFFLGSGIGVQPPVLGVFLLSLVWCFLFYALSKKYARLREFLSDILFLFFLILFFFFINMFWVLPVVNYILNSGYLNPSIDFKVFNLLSLLESTSRYNSFLNVFRLYGDNIWFDGFKGRLYLPFFADYLNNVVLIFLSVLFPLLAYSAILVSRERHVFFFTLTALGASFISKGIHPPFGEVFLWIFKNVPCFWIYRAPWQKFGLLIMLSYSYLAAVVCGYIYEKTPKVLKIGNKNLPFLKVAFIILIMGLHIFYHRGFILGKMLPTTEERVVLPGFHQKYPDYLFEAAEWINNIDDEFKILLLPDDKANAYYWGYGGAEDITLKLFQKGVIFRQYGEGMAPPHSLDKVYGIFVASLYNELTPYTGKIAGLLNVRYLLHRNDFIYNWAGDSDSPEFIKEKLSKQKGMYLERKVGKWDFYRNEYEFPHIYVPEEVIYVDGEVDLLPAMSWSEDFKSGVAFLFRQECGEDGSLLTDHYVKIEKNEIEIEAKDGRKEPFRWKGEGRVYKARYYEGIKDVIRTDGKESFDSLVFRNEKECPYTFPTENKNHAAYNSTLVYIETGTKPLVIERIYEKDKEVKDIVGIWWESGWVGMGTKSIIYPVKIPPKERAIIQINHIVKGKIRIFISPGKVEKLTGEKRERPLPTIFYKKINPTKYIIKVEKAKSPFWLVFSESFNSNWRLYLDESEGVFSFNWGKNLKFILSDIKYLFKRSDISRHYIINGYANGWYVKSSNLNWKENFTLCIYFWPQSLFYLGVIISTFVFIVSILGGVSYFIRKRREKK